MRLRLLYVLLCFLGFTASAQEEVDSLFVIKKNNKWSVKYMVKPGENMRMLSQRFYLSENVIEHANPYEDLKRLPAGTVLYIPVTNENFAFTRSALHAADYKELHYRAFEKDDISVISSYSGVTKEQMRTWNGLKGNTLPLDRPILVGWLKIMSLDSLNPVTFSAYPAPKRVVVQIDTEKIVVPGGLDTVYDRQTSNGLNVLTEKGTVVFFENTSKSSTVYLAFHNATPRGTIIKIHNPGTGKTTYAKVLGPLPATKLYSGAIIGLSMSAKEALGVMDDKAWCELTYSAN
jgi:peptidoglycan endopeptidase LytF